MNRRLLMLCILLLLASAALAFYVSFKPASPPPAPPIEVSPVETPIEPPKQADQPSAPPSPAVAEDDEEQEPQTQTVRTRLTKENLVKPSQSPDANISLKKPKARELVPGVTLENKELNIQLEKANESLNIRRSQTTDDQVQVIWKQKF